MPAAAIGALVDLQAAFALLLAPGKVFLRLCQRGVTILRFARLISLGAVALLRKVSMARIFPREHVVERIETAQLCVELRFFFEAIFRPLSSSCCCRYLTRQTHRKGTTNPKNRPCM